MKLPTIEIIFQQLASTLVKRSERGIALLILRDDTKAGEEIKRYQSERDLLVDKSKYKAENYQYLADTISFAPTDLYAVRIPTAGTLSDALALIARTVKTGWITLVGTTEDYTELAKWVKEQRVLENRTYKAIVFDSAADSRYVVNFGNEKITFADARKEQTGEKYLPSLAGILAACNIERGATSFTCSNLTTVNEPEDVEAALTAGKFVLINDFEDVCIGLGINSLTTLSESVTEDMKYIDIVEAMDLIEDDIRSTFKKQYQGKYKNHLDNQMLFVSAVDTYFNSLGIAEVLDPNYKNVSGVDTATQRAVWAKEKPEAVYWDDATVRKNAYKRSVFLAGDIKISGAMENLRFAISMF